MNPKACTAMSLWVAAGLFAPMANAQNREPLCVPVEAQRLAGGLAFDRTDEGTALIALPVPASSREARFVVATPVRRDGRHVLLGVRVDERLHRVGVPFVMGDPTTDVGRAVGVATADGALVLAIAGGNVMGVRVSADGAVGAWERAVEAPAPEAHEAPRGFAWLTATDRADGAVALAGTAEGVVFAMRFDSHGGLRGSAHRWSRQVGGPLWLLPTPSGPVSAFLGRPIPGTGPDNEPARIQVLLTLDDALDPTGQPFSTGFAQFPVAAVERSRNVVVLQWALQQGVAIATLPVGDHRIGEQLPRLWYAQPPLEGAPVGHGAAVDGNGIVYDLVAYGEREGGVLGHLAWIPPSGNPVIRRDVIPLRATAMAAPSVLPAADGVVVVVAGQDETGGAVDAYHVRCDLVTVRTVDDRAAP